MNSTLLVLSSLNVTVCKTEECQNVADLLLSGMNTTVDPCENFYEFVCGSWSNVCPATEKVPICNIDTEIEKSIKISLRDILEKKPRKKDSLALAVERKWYRACMNEDRIREKAYTPITKYFEEIGGWPMIMNPTDWKEENFPWQKVAQHYAKFSGKFSLFTITQTLNPNNTEQKIIMFDQLDGVQLDWSYNIKAQYYDDDYFDSYENDYGNYYLNSYESGFLKRYTNNLKESSEENYDEGYSSSYEDNYDDDYEEEKYVKLFIKIIEDYAESVGGNVENISDYFTEVFDFAKALYNISAEGKYDKEEMAMTIDEFQELYDSYEPGNSTAKINWLEMVNTLTMSSGLRIEGSEPILLFRKPYFEKLVPLLKDTPNRVIVNLVHSIFFEDSLNYLDKDDMPWEDEYEDDDDEDEEERWEYCIDHMNGLYFNTGLTQVFVQKYFPDDIKESAREIAEEVRNQVESDIFDSNLLDNDARQLVREKLKAMKFHIGYPDFFNNRTYLDHIYDGFKVGPDYFENVMNVLAFDHEEFWKEFREPFDKDQFLESPTILNAFYNKYDNSLTIPAAELLVPLFASSMPLSIKYGYLGFTVGHEINHGFDNDGRKFNKDGNRLPWLAEELDNKYEKNTNCFVGQFDHYGINGTLTQNENIADSAGLNSAFESYKNKMKTGNFKDIRLPELGGLSGEQLFFVSFAASFCTSTTPEVEEYWINNNEHSIEPHRVNGAVSNLKGFSKAFQCSDKSPMNPENKCLLWK